MEPRISLPRSTAMDAGTHQTCQLVRIIPTISSNPDIAIESIQWAEASSKPLLFPGLLSGWPALTLWKGPKGFTHLKQLAGNAKVQVMTSSSRIFFGDISRHQPSTMSFEQMLGLLESMSPPPLPQSLSPPPPAPLAAPQPSKEAAAAVGAAVASPCRDVGACDEAEVEQRDGSRCSDSSNSAGGPGGSISGNGGGVSISGSANSNNSSYPSSSSPSSSSSSLRGEDAISDGALHDSGSCIHVYLAQQPLTGGLACLQVDVPMPGCLYGKDITATNLWMCGGAVRSSLHYDPHHNLLVVVSGCKVVTVVPPYLTHCVYPMTLTGDAPNHSQVPFADTQPCAQHPAYLAALDAAAVVELQAGDALFLPEGWWHQVDSGPETTFAVNYWWRSALTQLLTAPPAPPPAALAAAMLSVQNPPRGTVPHRPSTAPTAAAEAAEVPTWASGPLSVAATSHVDEVTAAATAEAASSRPPPSTAPTAATVAAATDPLAGLDSTSARLAAPFSSSLAAEPGPGLRNLFALRQLARAAIEDIAEGLLACVAPAHVPAPAARGPSSDAAAAMTAAAIELLSSTVRQKTASGAVDADVGADGAAATQFTPVPATTATAAAVATAAPRPLLPHAAGLLLRLAPGEAVSLGLIGCSVAAALAALTPRLLAAALYHMCRTSSHLVSELLTHWCRVPAVACLLTSAFDQLGTAPGTAPGAVAAATKNEGAAEGVIEGDGGSGGGFDDGSGTFPAGSSRTDALLEDRPAKRRRYGSGTGQAVEGCGGAAGEIPAAHLHSGGDGLDTLERETGACGRTDVGAHRVALHDGDGEAGASVPNDFFAQLYDTVDDPDKVFRLLLEGRAALNTTARRLLLESVLA